LPKTLLSCKWLLEQNLEKLSDKALTEVMKRKALFAALGSIINFSFFIVCTGKDQMNFNDWKYDCPPK
jgi:hypothetical protein